MESANGSPRVFAETVGVSRKVLVRWITKLGCPCRTKDSGHRVIDKVDFDAWFDRVQPLKVPSRGPRVVRADDPREGIIYGLIDPQSRAICYIGQSLIGEARPKGHLSALRAKKHKNPKLASLWRKVNREGMELEYCVLERCPARAINDAECRWITQGRDGGWPLCNLTDGGEGGTFTDETKDKLSAIAGSKWRDPEYRRRWEDASAGRYGYTNGNEFREALKAKRDRKAAKRETPPRPTLAQQRASLVELMKTLTPLTHNGAAFIPLTNGKWAIVDVEDWERAGRVRWSCNRHSTGTSHRVKRNVRRDGKKSIVLLGHFIANSRLEHKNGYRNGNQLDCRRDNLLVKNA